jgi:transcriptional regulator with XRE-family HTH domain
VRGGKMKGNNLKKLRELSGLSQNKLAKLSGISQAQVSRIESNEQKMSEDLIKQVAQALGVSTDLLLNFKLEVKKKA